MKTKAEYLENRRKDDLVRSAQHLAHIYAGVMASKSRVPKDDLLFEAMAALGEAAVKFKPEINENFRAYAQICIRGKLCNYLRDKHRMVRLPRPISVQYMAYHKLQKEQPGLSQEQYAEALGLSAPELQNTIDNATLHHVELDPSTHLEPESEQPTETSEYADLVTRVVHEGCKVVSEQAGESYDYVYKVFFKALRTLLDE